MIPDPAKTWRASKLRLAARSTSLASAKMKRPRSTRFANGHMPKPCSVLCSEHGRRTEGRCAAPVTYRTFRTIEYGLGGPESG